MNLELNAERYLVSFIIDFMVDWELYICQLTCQCFAGVMEAHLAGRDNGDGLLGLVTSAHG